MINITSENEHVAYIKRQMRVIKEGTISVRKTLPFNKIPKILTICIVFTAARMLNYLPVKGGVFVILITKTIIYSETIHYKKHLWLNIGQY